MHVHIPMERTFHRLADSPREMDVGGVDRDAVGDILHAHDAVQRMFLFLGLFLMTGDRHDLGPVLLNHGPPWRHDPCRITVIDAMAGLT
jgi:hypothetical protein